MATNDKWKEKQVQDLTDEDEQWRVKAMTLCLLMISIDTCEKFAKAKAYAENLLDQALASPEPPFDNDASEPAPKRHCQLPIGASPAVAGQSTSTAQTLATRTAPWNSGASSSADGAVSKRQTQSRRFTEEDFAQWLLEIAPEGTLLPYVSAIHSQFYHTSDLLHLVIRPHDAGQPVLNCLEPGVWDALGIHKMGHKMLFARAVLALNATQQVPQKKIDPKCYGLSGEEQRATQNAKQKRNHSPPDTPKPPSQPPPARLLASRAPGQKKGSLSETNVHEEAVDVALTFPQVQLERARRLALATSGAATLTVQVAAEKT